MGRKFKGKGCILWAPIAWPTEGRRAGIGGRETGDERRKDVSRLPSRVLPASDVFCLASCPRNDETPPRVKRDGVLPGPKGEKKSRRRPTLARASPALPSAMEPLTSVFGMGTGMTTPLWPPAKELRVKNEERGIRSSDVLHAQPAWSWELKRITTRHEMRGTDLTFK